VAAVDADAGTYRCRADSNLMNRGRVEEALRWMDNMLERKQPQPVAVLLMWGKSNIYQRTEQPEEEIRLIEQLIGIRSHQLFEHNLGRAYSKLQRTEDAEKHYLKSLELKAAANTR
jgi:tetratricopeptide (TPR) repeat protein